MRALRIHGPGWMSIDDIDEPTLGPLDVLMRVDACCICGTDLDYLGRGVRRSNGDPWPLGHEAVGTIVAMGEEAEGYNVGMRVAVNPMAQRDNIIGNGGSEGAFADFLLMRSPVVGEHLHRIPASVSPERAALTEPLAVALHSVNVSRIQPGERAVVLGAGPIGLGAVYWLRERGIDDIAIVDKSAERLRRAGGLGARYLIDTLNEDLRERLAECHGVDRPLLGASTAGTDVFFDMAGAPTLLDQVISFGKSHARIVVTALYKGTLELDMRGLLLREMSILSSVGYPEEFGKVLEHLPTVSSAFEDNYVSHQFRFPAVDDAFAAAARGDSAKIVMLFNH